jgi:hypothetical protein
MTAPQPTDNSRARTRTEPETPEQHAERLRLLAERRQRTLERRRQLRRENAEAQPPNSEAAS